MKSNRGTSTRTPSRLNLYQTLSKEKEALVTMFLCSAGHNAINEQIRKIDQLCIQLDEKGRKPPAD